MTHDDITASIINFIAGIDGVATVIEYVDELIEADDLLSQPTPIVLIESRPAQMAEHHGSAGDGVDVNYSAFVMLRKTEQNSLGNCRNLTLKIARNIEHENYQMTDLGLGQVFLIDIEDPRPDLEQYRVCQIDWRHMAILS